MALPLRFIRQNRLWPPMPESLFAALLANSVHWESPLSTNFYWNAQDSGRPMAVANHLTETSSSCAAHIEGGCGIAHSITNMEPWCGLGTKQWYTMGTLNGRWYSTIASGVHSGDTASLTQGEANHIETDVSTSETRAGERALDDSKRGGLKDGFPVSFAEGERSKEGESPEVGQDDLVADILHKEDGESFLILSEEEGRELEQELTKRKGEGVIGEERDIDRGVSSLSEEEDKELEQELAKMESLLPVEPRQEKDVDPEREYYHVMKLDEIKKILQEVKGRDVEVMHVREKCNFTDYMVVVTGRSERHIRAMAEHVVRELTRRCAEVMEGLTPAVEGDPGQEWLLVDAGNIIVHFFTEDQREYYNLEGLWGGNAPKKRRYGPYGELLD